MRASCAICQELFTNDSGMCATPCGHTFHLDCLKPWVTEHQTCPQCRVKVLMKNVIAKLFFTATEVEASEVDSSKLKNELDDIRMCMRDKDKSIKQLQGEQQKSQERVSALRETINKLENIYTMEVTKNQTLKKELLCYKRQQEEAERARQEAVQLRAKLKQLESLDTLRNGLMSDIQERARNATAKDLAEWVVIQEKEMKRKRIECRQLQEQKERVSKEYKSVRKCLEMKSKEYTVLEDRLKLKEGDLQNVEEKYSSLKRKFDALQKSVDSPSGVGNSLAYRLINESPAPQPIAKRPRLSQPGPEFNLDLSENNCTPSLKSKTSASDIQSKHESKDFGTKNIKLSSVTNTFTKERSKQSDLDVQVSSFNILKRKAGSGYLKENQCSSSAIRVGYNGLGGHTKFIQPKGFVKGKSTAKKGLLTKNNRSNFMPPLLGL